MPIWEQISLPYIIALFSLIVLFLSKSTVYSVLNLLYVDITIGTTFKNMTPPPINAVLLIITLYFRSN